VAATHQKNVRPTRSRGGTHAHLTPVAAAQVEHGGRAARRAPACRLTALVGEERRPDAASRVAHFTRAWGEHAALQRQAGAGVCQHDSRRPARARARAQTRRRTYLIAVLLSRSTAQGSVLKTRRRGCRRRDATRHARAKRSDAAAAGGRASRGRRGRERAPFMRCHAKRQAAAAACAIKIEAGRHSPTPTAPPPCSSLAQDKSGHGKRRNSSIASWPPPSRRRLRRQSPGPIMTDVQGAVPGRGAAGYSPTVRAIGTCVPGRRPSLPAASASASAGARRSGFPSSGAVAREVGVGVAPPQPRPGSRDGARTLASEWRRSRFPFPSLLQRSAFPLSDPFHWQAQGSWRKGLAAEADSLD